MNNHFTPSEKAATCSICLLTYLRNCGHCAFNGEVVGQSIDKAITDFSNLHPTGFDAEQCANEFPQFNNGKVSAKLLDMMAQGRLYFVDGVYKIRSNYVPEKLEA